MKIMSLIKNFEQKHANMTLFIGIAIGVGVGMFLFAWLVPGSARLVRMYNTERYERYGARGGYMMIQGGRQQVGNSMMQNSYYASPVTSENQFLQRMILNHEEAIRLSQQVLALKGVSNNISAFAESMIAADTSWIKTLKAWTTATSTSNR